MLGGVAGSGAGSAGGTVGSAAAGSASLTDSLRSAICSLNDSCAPRTALRKSRIDFPIVPPRLAIFDGPKMSRAIVRSTRSLNSFSNIEHLYRNVLPLGPNTILHRIYPSPVCLRRSGWSPRVIPRREETGPSRRGALRRCRGELAAPVLPAAAGPAAPPRGAGGGGRPRRQNGRGAFPGNNPAAAAGRGGMSGT